MHKCFYHMTLRIVFIIWLGNKRFPITYETFLWNAQKKQPINALPQNQTGKRYIRSPLIEGPPPKPLNTIVMWCTGGFREPSIRPPWCQETPVSRTAMRLFGVVFSSHKKPIYFVFIWIFFQFHFHHRLQKFIQSKDFSKQTVLCRFIWWVKFALFCYIWK